MAQKLGLRLSDEAYEQLRTEAEAKGVQIAQHVRNILDAYFKQEGKAITAKVQWGGYRRKSKDS